MDKLISLVFPPKCMICHCVCKEELCARCAGFEAHRQTQVNGVSCISAAVYEGKLRDAILAFKFRGRKNLARPLGALIIKAVKTAWPDARPDVVTWVPVSPKRLRERGYDQAYLLAKAVARRLEVPVKPALCKLKHTVAQSSLPSGDARRDNVAGAYALLPGVSFTGQRVLLIDDILTTGATLSQALETLTQAGGAYACAVAARTEGGLPQGIMIEKGILDTTYSK